MKWYVVHTYASQEFKVKEAIEKGIIGTPLEGLVGEIIIPVQKTFHIREGKKIEREKRLFNSYIILQADLTAELITFILAFGNVTNFLGHGKKPQPLPEAEVNRLLGISDREKNAVQEYKFLPGDPIKIISGPFSDFEGLVDKINPDSNKLIIKVTVFGRVTPVEVSIDQVEIIE